MIILPPKEIEDKIKFIHNDVVAINCWSSIEKFKRRE